MIKYVIKPKRNLRNNTVKYYAQIAPINATDLSEVASQIEAQSTVSAADVKGVLDQLQTVIQEQLRAGRSVRLGDLGSFRPTLSSSRSDTEAAVSARNIKRVNVIYTPSGSLRRALKSALTSRSLKFELVKPKDQAEEGGEA